MPYTAAVLAALALLAVPAAVHADGPAKRPMKIDDLFAFKRVSDPQISPDGKAVVYVVAEVDLPGNKTTSSLWLAPTDGKGEPKRLTTAAGKKDAPPALESRRQAHPVRVEPLRRRPALDHRPGRRRGPAADDDQHRGQRCGLVAGRQADRLRLRGLSRILREAVQGKRRAEQEAQGGGGEEPRQGQACSPSCSTATGTNTSRTSGSTVRHDGGAAASRRT